MYEAKEPLLKWFYVDFDWIVNGGVVHILEAKRYKGLRHHWVLDGKTGERKNIFYVHGNKFDTLKEAVDFWVIQYGEPRKERVRL